jgi:hypothetical protein
LLKCVYLCQIIAKKYFIYAFYLLKLFLLCLLVADFFFNSKMTTKRNGPHYYQEMAKIHGNSMATGQYARGSNDPLATEVTTISDD